MTPLFFGTGDRRLFGVYEPGRAGSRAPRAAVLCHPWGQEYLRAHRSMRQLANMLAAAGWDTLRFDYYGTGDSAGDIGEASLAGWEKDIEWAIEEAKDTSGANRVTLVGLRLGASLAARVAARRGREVEALVMWDPVVRGQDFLDDVFALEEAISGAVAPTRARADGGGHDVLGFALTTAMADEIRSVEIVSIVPTISARTLALVTQPTASHVALTAAFAGRSPELGAVECAPGQPPWLEDRNRGAGAVPVDALQRAARWLS